MVVAAKGGEHKQTTCSFAWLWRPGGGITHMKFEWFEAAKRGRAKKLNHMKLRMVVAAKGGAKNKETIL